MNLVDQIFEQAKVGTHLPVSNAFAEGVQLAQRQQQLEIEQKQLPVTLLLHQQEADMNAAKLNQFLQDRDNEAKASEAFAGLYNQVSPLVGSGKIEEAQDAIIKAAMSNGFLLADPKKRLQGLFDMTTKAQEGKLELVKARQNQFAPSITTLVDPTSGKPYTVVQTGPHASQVLDPEKAALQKQALDLRRQKLVATLPDIAKLEAHSLYKEIDRKREQLADKSAYPDEVWSFGFPPKKVANPKRAKLEAEVNQLREDVKKLTGKDADAAPTGEFEEGVTYTDAEGNKAVYRGGKFEPVP